MYLWHQIHISRVSVPQKLKYYPFISLKESYINKEQFSQKGLKNGKNIELIFVEYEKINTDETYFGANHC